MIARDALIQQFQKLLVDWRADAEDSRTDGEAAERRQMWPTAAGKIHRAVALEDCANDLEPLIRDLLTLIDQGWQPIETAPKDGTWIIVGWFELPGQCFYQRAFWHTADGGRWCDTHTAWTGAPHQEDPTHWRPELAHPIRGSGQTDETTKERA